MKAKNTPFNVYVQSIYSTTSKSSKKFHSPSMVDRFSSCLLKKRQAKLFHFLPLSFTVFLVCLHGLEWCYIILVHKIECLLSKWDLPAPEMSSWLKWAWCSWGVLLSCSWSSANLSQNPLYNCKHISIKNNQSTSNVHFVIELLLQSKKKRQWKEWYLYLWSTVPYQTCFSQLIHYLYVLGISFFHKL